MLTISPIRYTISTLQRVLHKVDKNVIVIVQPLDVPLLNKIDLTSIINKNNTIVIPKCDEKNGHPVKLKSEFWTTLLAVDLSSKEARLDLLIKKFNTSSITYIKVLDISVYQNINTVNDWKIYLETSIYFYLFFLFILLPLPIPILIP